MVSFRNDTLFTEADEHYIFGPDDFIVGIIISVACLLGFIVQALVVYGAYRMPKMRTTFGALMLNEIFGQFLACFVTFVFYFSGLVVSSLTIISHSRYFGNASVTLLPSILISAFLMSFNRVCASSMPFKYRAIFNKKTMKIYIFINWTFPVTIFSYFFLFKSCNFVFFQFGWVFMEALATDKCGSELVVLSITIMFLVTFAIICCDVITFIILITCRRKIFKTHSKEFTSRETNFAVQVLVQGVNMMIFGVFYTSGWKILPGNALNWKIFITTSFAANLLHCSAPAVICMFNAEYRRWIISFFRNRRTKKTVTVVTSRLEASK